MLKTIILRINPGIIAVMIISASSLLISSCGNDIYMPTKDDARKFGKNLTVLKEGRKIYMDKCGACHSPLFQPDDFPRAHWHEYIRIMQFVAKIDTVQKNKILDYIEVRSVK
jgi:hypothetical protein